MASNEFSTSKGGLPIVIRHGQPYKIEEDTDVKTFWQCNYFYKTKGKYLLQTIANAVFSSIGVYNLSAEANTAAESKR